MRKSCYGIDWTRVKKSEVLYISSIFDISEWWITVGHRDNHLVYLVVPSIVALLPSNSFQEPIFSACTWFDNPLRQRQKDGQFEMAVLLAVNEALLSCKIPSEEEAREIVERVIVTFSSSSLESDKEKEADSLL